MEFGRPFVTWTGFQWGLAALAVTFQFLATLEVQGNFVRVGAADFVIPILALAAARQWLSGRLPMPRWRMRHIWAWLAVITLLLAVGLVMGRFTTGAWQKWALVNKFGGWLVLVTFFLVGSWVGQKADRRDSTTFVIVLIWIAAAICLVDLCYLSFRQFVGGPNYVRAQGWAGNPNAFGFLYAAVVCIALADERWRTTRYADVALLAIMLAAIAVSGSRSAFLGLAFGVAALSVVGRVPWRTVFQTVAGAVIIVSLVYGIPALGKSLLLALAHDPTGDVVSGKVIVHPYFLRANPLVDSGVSHRIRITLHALELWKANPVMGIGLGSFYWLDLRVHGENGATIHNTALWLLTELGVVGLGTFAAFFVLVITTLWKARHDLDPLAIGSFAVLAVFLGASVGMEAMYQRHLWFLAGYAMVLPHPCPGARRPLRTKAPSSP